MEIKVYRDEDLKKDGRLKKKNNAQIINEEEFIKYVKENNLTLSTGYIDVIGFLSNGQKFKCYYKGIIIGVTGIINKLNGDDTNEWR